jgi:hypothetical protein
MVEPLRDPAYFARVFLEDGAPTWPNGLTLHPAGCAGRSSDRRAFAGCCCVAERGARVLRMRFGICMNTDHTLEEVGQQFSRERIRQIEARALRAFLNRQSELAWS